MTSEKQARTCHATKFNNAAATVDALDKRKELKNAAATVDAFGKQKQHKNAAATVSTFDKQKHAKNAAATVDAFDKHKKMSSRTQQRPSTHLTRASDFLARFFRAPS